MSIAERVRARVLKANIGEAPSNDAQPDQAPGPPPEPEPSAQAPAETASLVARVADRFSKITKSTV